MPNPLVGIAAGVLVDEPGDTADDQGDWIDSTQHTFATARRALLTLPQLSQAALKRSLRAQRHPPETRSLSSLSPEPNRTLKRAPSMQARRPAGSKPFLHPVGSLARDNAGRHFRPPAGLGIFVSSCSEFEKLMFTLLRGAAIIGLIFYFSPARNLAEPGRPKGGEEHRPVPAAPAAAPSEVQEGPWNRLVGSLKEEAVRTAMDEKTLSAGLRLKDSATRLMAEMPAVPAPPERPRSSALEWALREAYDPSVRCVYRCDGTE